MKSSLRVMGMLILTALLAVFLTACGSGGGGGDGNGGNGKNNAPVANAGPDQNVTTGSLVTLDGSGSSDADGDLLTYNWSFTSKPQGSTAALSDCTVMNPTFTADVDGTYVISLIVNDGTFDSEPNMVTVTASLTTAIASNQSISTLCAEDDNINIPFSGDVTSFVIEATHPSYEVGTDICTPDFSNCPPPEPGHPFTPCVYKLFDDGETVIEAVREAEWWRPNGMEVSVDAGTPVTDIHYVRVYRKIAGANEWPQYFVIYMDGNLRLIPHPPVGVTSVCFGSSVIIGPASIALRPIAEITSARYVSASKSMEVLYQTGGSATLDLQEVNRTIARVPITVNYPTSTLPFATFRSMFVINGNADVDHVLWRNTSGALHDDPIMTFSGGEGTEWFFYRSSWSQHNTSAPDIRIRLD
ncbi:MAG: hypothetical protein IID16_07665 [Candidatus Marinimicrobia bacterium]|nr:hypothetical protein [Candidatus Neomarinimicrobiota bacterium]